MTKAVRSTAVSSVVFLKKSLLRSSMMYPDLQVMHLTNHMLHVMRSSVTGLLISSITIRRNSWQQRLTLSEPISEKPLIIFPAVLRWGLKSFLPISIKAGSVLRLKVTVR